MDYSALVSAERNRDASRKLFEQWTNHNNYHHSTNSVQPGGGRVEDTRRYRADNRRSDTRKPPSCPKVILTTNEVDNEGRPVFTQSAAIEAPTQLLMDSGYGAAANGIDKWRTGSGGLNASQPHLFSSSTPQQQHHQPAPVMLHRSPSGAQKKIRQKREERQQQQRLASGVGSQLGYTTQPTANFHPQSPRSSENTPGVQCRTTGAAHAAASSSHTASSFSSSVPSSPIDYRNLTQLNGYKSILPPPTLGLDDVWRRPVAVAGSPLSTEITASSRFSATVDKPPVTNLHPNRILSNGTPPSVATNNSSAYSVLRGNSIEEDDDGNSGEHMLVVDRFSHRRGSSGGASSLDTDAGNYQNLSFEGGNLHAYADFSPQHGCYNTGGVHKPVGQVHPMPAPTSRVLSNGSTPSSSPPDTLMKRFDKVGSQQQPPPLPKKPAKVGATPAENVHQNSRLPPSERFSKSLDLAPAGERHASAASGDELDTPTFPSWTSSTVVKESRPDAGGNEMERASNNSKCSTSLSNLLVTDHLTIVNGNGGAAHSGSSGLSSITQSTDSLPRLSASPSMLSLQNSLHHALSNPEQHTAEQLDTLEKRRLESIESLSRRAAERQQDLEAVCDELNSIDQIRLHVFKALHGQNRLLSRLAIQVVQAERLVELETRLQLQLEKHSHAMTHVEHQALNDGEEPAMVVARKRRLAQQMEDALQLRAHYDSRDAELDRELAQMLPGEALLEWCFYKTNAVKLNVEKKQLEDRLRGVKSQLKFLDSVALRPASHHVQHS